MLISAFPGVGKTYCFTNGIAPDSVANPNATRVIIDSDSSRYPKDTFPESYIEYIQATQLHLPKATQLISTHDVVLKRLDELQLIHWVVLPKRSCKAEYLERYKNRGSPEAFINLLNEKWDTFIDSLHTHLDTSRYASGVILNHGCYLSDWLGQTATS